jgi:hypothetical protein
LGIFNGGRKSLSVIPHKVLIALSSQRALITAKSAAMKEACMKSRINCILIEPENPKELAKNILLLKNDVELRKYIAKEGYKNFQSKLSMKVAGKTLVSYFYWLVNKNNRNNGCKN